MIIKFVMKFLPTCLPSGLTVAAPDAFGRIPGVCIYLYKFLNVCPIDYTAIAVCGKVERS